MGDHRHREYRNAIESDVRRRLCFYGFTSCPVAGSLIGTGNDVWLPPSALREALRGVKVVLDAMQTGPAIRTYNIMMGERRRVAAALIAVP